MGAWCCGRRSRATMRCRYAGTHDDLADITDVQTLINQLPNTTVIHSDVIQDYAHMVCCYDVNTTSRVR